MKNIDLKSINHLEREIIENRKRDQDEVLKLNHWERDLISKDILNNDNLNYKKEDFSNMNWKGEVRQKLRNIPLSKNFSFKKFFKAGEHEQGSILLQNLNCSIYVQVLVTSTSRRFYLVLSKS